MNIHPLLEPPKEFKPSVPEKKKDPKNPPKPEMDDF